MSALSLADRIRPLAREGLSPAEIALATGIDRDTVRGTLSRMRRGGEELPRHSGGWPRKPSLQLDLHGDAFARLKAEAARRDTDPSALVQRLVHTIARDRLFSAVLD